MTVRLRNGWFDSLDKLRNQLTNREQFLEVANMRNMEEHCGGRKKRMNIIYARGSTISISDKPKTHKCFQYEVYTENSNT